jgi:Flp pilus assembly protein TadD
MRLGHHGAAIQLLDCAIRLAPGDTTHYHNRACVCLRAGDRQGAVHTLYQAFQISPSARASMLKDPDFAELLADPEARRVLGV